MGHVIIFFKITYIDYLYMAFYNTAWKVTNSTQYPKPFPKASKIEKVAAEV